MASSSSDVVNKVLRYKLQLTNTEETAKVLKILKKLQDLKITLDVLAETGIGKTVNSLRRHDLVGDLAKSLVRDWKKLMLKGSKSPTMDDTWSVKDKVDKKANAMAGDDLNNNCLNDEREEDEVLNKKIKTDHDGPCNDEKDLGGEDDAKQLEMQSISTNGFLNKSHVIDKKGKKYNIDQCHKKSGGADINKRQKSEHIIGKRKSKSHKREEYTSLSDSGSDCPDSGTDKKPLKESKSKGHFCPESSKKMSKDEQPSVILRHSEAQNRKRKKRDGYTFKETNQSPVSRNKAKREDKESNSDTEEPAMSFESYLNYDVNVSQRKEQPKAKKHPKKGKPALKEKIEKSFSIQPVEILKCVTASVNACATEKSTKERDIMSPPLESYFSEVGIPSSVKTKAEKESDSCDILEESGIFTGQRFNKKMQVYSGAKTIFLPAMMSLYQQCIRTLQNNINLLYETGGVPFEILEPVLERCTPEQLLRIEEYNPMYIGVTDHLWGKHCRRDFKDSKLQEYESWKEMYLRLSEERERKFLMLTKTIVSAQSCKPKGRQVKMAFIHSVAKPPRDVRIKQEIHGTAVQQPQLKCSVKIHDSTPRQMCKEPTRSSSTTSALSNSQDLRKKTRVAPMMAKSLKAFKKQFGHR